MLLPIGIAAIAGIFLLLWSFAEHLKCKGAYKESGIKATHIIALTALTVSAVITAWLALGEERELLLFYLMKDIPIFFKIDEISRWFVLVVTVVWVLVGFYSITYMKHEGEEKRFFGFYLLVYSVLIALDFSGNLVTMYLFYELMTLTSFPLVLHNGSREAIMASLKYLFYSMCGAYMGLFGIFFLNKYVGILPFVAGGQVSNEVMAQHSGMLLLAVFVMIVGFGAKAGMFPLHAWLPTAHPVAPSPASAALSGIIVKGGVLAIVRVIFYVMGVSNLQGTWPMDVLMVLSLLTVFMGSLLAFREPVVKKRFAYSTVSQVSYILFGLFVLTPQGFTGALLHVAFHAIVKCGLFLTAGVFLFDLKITRVEDLAGVGKRMPVTIWCYTFFALALVGIPPTNGFVSKWYLAQGALTGQIGVLRYVGPAILLASALMTAGYLLPITMKGFFPGEVEVKDIMKVKKEPSPWMLIPLMILALLALGLGMFPNELINLAGRIAALVY